MGTSNFLLLGQLENPNLPILSHFPVSVRLAGKASGGEGGNEGVMCQFGQVTEYTLAEAWSMALKAKQLVRGSLIILCTPGKRKDLG